MVFVLKVMKKIKLIEKKWWNSQNGEYRGNDGEILENGKQSLKNSWK